MDLFSSVIEATTIDENVDEQVIELCEFVKSLDNASIKQVATAREAISFEAWQPAVTGLQAFAYSNGLKDDWWRIVDLVTSSRKGILWNAAWNAAYDHSVSLLLKPYVGTGIPAPYYELLTGPLIEAGWNFKKVFK